MLFMKQQPEMSIPVILKCFSQGERDGTWLQTCRCNLIIQGLKLVKIVPVDQYYLKVFFG